MGKSETEERILQAARHEFMCHGYDGTRMRSIAERAEINKGLLHYYFQTKEALLVHVFQETFGDLMEALEQALASKSGLFEKIEAFVSTYTDFMLRHPRLPLFIINEMNRDGRNHHSTLRGANIKPPTHLLLPHVEEAKQAGLIHPDVRADQLFLNMISLVLFPFTGKNMVKFMHGLNETEYKLMIQARKHEISSLLIRSIAVPTGPTQYDQR